MRYLKNCRRPGIEEDRAVIRVVMPNTNEVVFRQAAQAFILAMGVAAGDEKVVLYGGQILSQFAINVQLAIGTDFSDR